MGLLAAATVSFSACSSDDINSTTNQDVDGMYMTLSVVGSSSNGTRTYGTSTENGTTEESTIGNGTVYLYEGNTCVFKKTLTSSDWSSTPSDNTAGKTKPIKVAVTSVKTGTKYKVYFMANKTATDYADPMASSAAFTASTTGGSDYAKDNLFVMFNQNDYNNKITDAPTVEFTTNNKTEDTAATTSADIKLDRVVARIDKPTITATNVTNSSATKNVTEMFQSITLTKYAVSNLNNNSYIVQNWDSSSRSDYASSTLSAYITGKTPYYKAYSEFGDKYKELGFTSTNTLFYNWTSEGNNKDYCFENTVEATDVNNATALYFAIKANLNENASTGADFSDGTFYRYDGKLYTKISDIYTDVTTNGSTNPFVVNNIAYDANIVLGWIKNTDGTLVAEGGTLNGVTGDGVDAGIKDKTLSWFRENFSIQVYRAGIMYYRWAITDNNYDTESNGTYNHYSVLRNSIYRLNVSSINEVGKDVPNGPSEDEITPNYYMTVNVSINPWVLNTKSITLK